MAEEISEVWWRRKERVAPLREPKRDRKASATRVSARTAAVEVAAGGMVRIQWLGMAEAHRRSRLDWSWATLTVCRSSHIDGVQVVSQACDGGEVGEALGDDGAKDG